MVYGTIAGGWGAGEEGWEIRGLEDPIRTPNILKTGNSGGMAGGSSLGLAFPSKRNQCEILPR